MTTNDKEKNPTAMFPRTCAPHLLIYYDSVTMNTESITDLIFTIFSQKHALSGVIPVTMRDHDKCTWCREKLPRK